MPQHSQPEVPLHIDASSVMHERALHLLRTVATNLLAHPGERKYQVLNTRGNSWKEIIEACGDASAVRTFLESCFLGPMEVLPDGLVSVASGNVTAGAQRMLDAVTRSEAARRMAPQLTRWLIEYLECSEVLQEWDHWKLRVIQALNGDPVNDPRVDAFLGAAQSLQCDALAIRQCVRDVDAIAFQRCHCAPVEIRRRIASRAKANCAQECRAAPQASASDVERQLAATQLITEIGAMIESWASLSGSQGVRRDDRVAMRALLDKFARDGDVSFLHNVHDEWTARLEDLRAQRGSVFTVADA
jgi:hypothetical protein